MRHTLKKYFIPHRENDYKPHVLREFGVLMLASAILSILFVSYVQLSVLTEVDLFAAVVPSILIDLANGDRQDATLRLLTPNAVLQAAAQEKANDMAKLGYFAHTSPAGLTPWYWFERVGYKFAYAGENLAVNFSDSKDVDVAWMNSPGHRANILNKNFTEIGIATARGMYQGRETTFVVQMFGRPARANTNTPKVVFKQTSEKPSVVEAVKGSSIEQVAEKDMFVSVKDADIVQETILADVPQEKSSKLLFIKTLLASPKTTSMYAYLILAIFIVVSLVLTICIEIRRQHPRHIIYGILLLALIIGVLYVQNTYLFPIVLIK